MLRTHRAAAPDVDVDDPAVVPPTLERFARRDRPVTARDAAART